MASDPLIDEAVRALRNGGVVAVPTDTVYGLAADPFDPEAMSRLFSLKGRSAAKRTPWLVAETAQLESLVEPLSSLQVKLVETFWPGPLTLVVRGKGIPADLLAPGGTIAVRVPAAPSCLELIRRFAGPVTGTSANRSGEPPCVTAHFVAAQMGEKVDVVVPGDEEVKGGAPSTVVEVAGERLIIHRAGAIGTDELQSLGVKTTQRDA